MMQNQFFSGTSVNWLTLGVEGAYNVHTGKRELISDIPEGKYLKVVLAEDVNSNVSDGVCARAMRKARKRDYLILHNGKAVGYATFHRKPQEYKVRVTLTSDEVLTVMAKSERDACRVAREFASERAEGTSVWVSNVEIA